jgi:hypothetical protein
MVKVLSNIDTSPLPEFATTRSGTPSTLKSPTARDLGLVPTANGLPGPDLNPPVPSPSSTVTSLLTGGCQSTGFFRRPGGGEFSVRQRDDRDHSAGGQRDRHPIRHHALRHRGPGERQ